MGFDVHMSTKNIEKKKTALPAKVICAVMLVIMFLQNAMTAALILKVHNIGILPTKYLLIPIFLTAVLDVLAILTFVFKKFVPAILLLILGLILFSVELYTFSVVKKSDEVINAVSENADKEYIEMCVLVRAGDEAQHLEDINGYKVGYCRNEKYAGPVIDTINSTAENVIFTEESSIVSTMDSLIGERVNAIIVKITDLSMISEYRSYANFGEKIRVLYTQEVEVDNAEFDEDIHIDYDYVSNEDSMVVYISGIDSWGATQTRSRSDLNLLMVINKKTNKVQLINTPRDYYVYLPYQKDMDKLTHAGAYGIESSIAAIENVYGVKIDYYARVNFEGFEKIIDSIGGVDVYSEYDFTAVPRYDELAGEWHKAEHYDQGINHLNGAQALIFARERAAFDTGDIQRGKNQMELIKGVVKKITYPVILVKYDELLENIKKCVVTDIPSEDIYSFIRYQLSSGKEWEIKNYTVTGHGEYMITYTIPDEENFVIIPNEDEVNSAKDLISNVLSD